VKYDWSFEAVEFGSMAAIDGICISGIVSVLSRFARPVGRHRAGLMW